MNYYSKAELNIQNETKIDIKISFIYIWPTYMLIAVNINKQLRTDDKGLSSSSVRERLRTSEYV
jgi:hypothetical protein